MALLAWLKREGFGSYESLDDFTGELGRRSSSALGALGAALVAKPEDLVEAAKGDGHGICAEVVGDLRVAKGARLAALKAVLMAGAGAHLPKLFTGAFDLSGDSRLPDADRQYLVKSGLKAFLDGVPAQAVNLDVLRAAASTETAGKSGAKELVEEVLKAYPANHTPVLTLRHAAFGDALPPELEQRWLDVLGRQHRAAKNAPPAAKRLGTAPVWPPVAPESMQALLKKAESAAPAAPSAPGPVAPKPAPAAPAKTDPDAPVEAAKKEMPALRPRARSGPGTVNEESFRADDAHVKAESLRTAPVAAPEPPAPQAEPNVTAAALTSPRAPAPLKSIRFGEQIELIATRGTRALERLMAAFDVRSEIAGRDKALAELANAAHRRGPKDVNQPMLDELFTFAADLKTPPYWRLAARAVLEHLSPDRFAALPEAVVPRESRYARPNPS